MTATWVLVKEVRNIVDEASNADEWAGLGLFKVYIYDI
jgi:hypothetical protein